MGAGFKGEGRGGWSLSRKLSRFPVMGSGVSLQENLGKYKWKYVKFHNTRSRSVTHYSRYRLTASVADVTVLTYASTNNQ